jgi:lipid-binding SYLF domain-containing protein
MSKHNYLFTFILIIVFAMVSASAGPLFAERNSKDEAERARQAADVLTGIMGIPEGGIPDELMENARGIAVIPHVVSAAFGIGGRYGKGLMAERDANGKWSAPAYVSIEGGSFGLQIGVEATDLVLVFTNDEGIKSLLKGKVTLGADATVAAGPVGRTASAGTDVLLRSSIFSYSRSKGLFAGVSLEGAAITIDNEADAKAYGSPVSGQDILVDHKLHANRIVMPFVSALKKYSPSSQRTTRQ